MFTTKNIFVTSLMLTYSLAVSAAPTMNELSDHAKKKSQAYSSSAQDAVKRSQSTIKQTIQKNGQFFNSTRKQADAIANRAITGTVNGTPDKQNMIDTGVNTFVFVSRSMPEDVLLTLFRQGLGQHKTFFVLRGWGEGDVNQAFNWVETVYEKLGDVPNIIVYPQLFDFYKIRRVPAVAHQDRDKNWYLIQGALSIDATIEEIRRRNFKHPLSRQWPVVEPDQAAVERNKVSKTDWKKWDQQNRKALAQTFLGTLQLPYSSVTETTSYTPYKILDYDVKDRFGKTIFPKGTKLNPLDADPSGKRTFLFVDGTDPWQVRFTLNLVKRLPDTTVFYTRLGNLSESGVEIYPLNEAFRKSFGLQTVPSVYIQSGNKFIVKTFKRK